MPLFRRSHNAVMRFFMPVGFDSDRVESFHSTGQRALINLATREGAV